MTDILMPKAPRAHPEQRHKPAPAKMRAGAAFAHSIKALELLNDSPAP